MVFLLFDMGWNSGSTRLAEPHGKITDRILSRLLERIEQLNGGFDLLGLGLAFELSYKIIGH